MAVFEVASTASLQGTRECACNLRTPLGSLKALFENYMNLEAKVRTSGFSGTLGCTTPIEYAWGLHDYIILLAVSDPAE